MSASRFALFAMLLGLSHCSALNAQQQGTLHRSKCLSPLGEGCGLSLALVETEDGGCCLEESVDSFGVAAVHRYCAALAASRSCVQGEALSLAAYLAALEARTHTICVSSRLREDRALGTLHLSRQLDDDEHDVAGSDKRTTLALPLPNTALSPTQCRDYAGRATATLSRIGAAAAASGLAAHESWDDI